MSGKPKKNIAPKDEEPLENDVPVEEMDEQFAEKEAAVVSEPQAKQKGTPKKEQPAKPEKKKASGGYKLSSVDPIILASFTVFIVACLIVTGVTAYGIIAGENDDKVAEYGDKVIANYTGSYFAYYDESGVVFDTSIESIGTDDTYPKSYEFSKTDFDTITVTIGDGKYLADFENALIGHKPGDEIRVMIHNGYGDLTDDVNKFTKAKVGVTVDKITQFDNADKYKAFFGSDAATSGIVKSPYGWDANVIENTDGTISVEYNPAVDTTYTVTEGVGAKVTAVGSTITFDYVIDNFAENTKMLKGIVDGETVYIIAADDTNITYKTTAEKVGIDLYFVMEFVGYPTS